MIGPLELMYAFLLDIAIGDPRWLPHPVRMIGKAITFLELHLRSLFAKNNDRIAGICLVILTVLPAGFLAFAVRRALVASAQGVFAIVAACIMVYLIATTIALRELVSSASSVIDLVKKRDLIAARRKLSMIVGRDTEKLNEDGVLRATIETVAENLSDGVIAPLFYLVVGGFPLAVAYKAINTLDSMVGYKNEKYLSFGRAAAKLDDAANFIPARITGFLIVTASFCYFLFQEPGRASLAARKSFAVMRRDGRNHSSPNSGIPEAAMAGALGITLGGPSTYGGVVVQKPFIGDDQGRDYLEASTEAVMVVMLGAVIAVMTGVALLSLRVNL